jgi:hypothetical protein
MNKYLEAVGLIAPAEVEEEIKTPTAGVKAEEKPPFTEDVSVKKEPVRTAAVTAPATGTVGETRTPRRYTF